MWIPISRHELRGRRLVPKRCEMPNRFVCLVFFCGVAAATTLFVPAAQAQEQTATIVGTVSIPGGGAAVRARVILTDARRGPETTTVTDEQGRFRFMFLEPGHYRVAA